MKSQNELALVIGYYLSRLDIHGYTLLGYRSFTEATRKIGIILAVKPNTIKNMRDEFDPYHQNNRIGWRRELRASRLRVLEAFQKIDDETLVEIVKEILGDSSLVVSKVSFGIQKLLHEDLNVEAGAETIYIPRGATGKAAEEAFIQYHKQFGDPAKGALKDTRELGCGYDFEIINEQGTYCIEVKGLNTDSGGILFTNKEWQTARKLGDRYYLVIIKNLSKQYQVTIIQNPASKLYANKSINTIIQVSWGVPEKSLNTYLTR